MPRFKNEKGLVVQPGEIWAEVEGTNGDYLVSTHGRVYSCIRDRVMSAPLNHNGYPNAMTRMSDGKIKGNLVHRLVAAAFLPNERGCRIINHKNGIKNDNRVENLEWCTYSENNQHAYDTGLKARRKHNNHYNAKLTEEQAWAILISDRAIRHADIARQFNTTLYNVWQIRNGRSWRYLTERKNKLTSEQTER